MNTKKFMVYRGTNCLVFLNYKNDQINQIKNLKSQAKDI